MFRPRAGLSLHNLSQYMEADDVFTVVNDQSNHYKDESLFDGVQHIFLVGLSSHRIFHIVASPLLSRYKTHLGWSEQVERTLFDVLKEVPNSSGYIMTDLAIHHTKLVKISDWKIHVPVPQENKFRKYSLMGTGPYSYLRKSDSRVH